MGTSVYNNIILGLGYCNNSEEIKADKNYNTVCNLLNRLGLDNMIDKLDKDIYSL